jgi:hypothetical protein
MAWTRADKLAAYEALVGDVADLQLKGKASRYTAMNGNMFSFLSPEGDLAFRLPKAEREAFLVEHPEAVVVQYDTVMKDYVGVPDALLEDAAELGALFERTVANARTLKAKPTKRPKKAK